MQQATGESVGGLDHGNEKLLISDLIALPCPFKKNMLVPYLHVPDTRYTERGRVGVSHFVNCGQVPDLQRIQAPPPSSSQREACECSELTAFVAPRPFGRSDHGHSPPALEGRVETPIRRTSSTALPHSANPWSAGRLQPCLQLAEQTAQRLELVAAEAGNHPCARLRARHHRLVGGLGALLGELDQDASAIVRIGAPRNQVAALEPVEPAGDARRGEHQGARELGRREPLRGRDPPERVEHAHLASVQAVAAEDLVVPASELKRDAADPLHHLRRLDV